MKALTAVAKILMNSLYGKFAQRVDIEGRYTFDEPEIGVPFKKLGNNVFKLHIVEKERGNETIVCWASYITSYARCALYSFFPEKGLYYCDTDSIVITEPLSDEVISATELGLMKLEDNIVESYYVAPKRYAYINDIGEEVKKIKGIPKKTVEMLSIDSFGCDMGIFYSKPYKIKTALQKNVKAYTEEIVKKNMSTINQKRLFKEDGSSIPIRILINDEKV